MLVNVVIKLVYCFGKGLLRMKMLKMGNLCFFKILFIVVLLLNEK